LDDKDNLDHIFWTIWTIWTTRLDDMDDLDRTFGRYGQFGRHIQTMWTIWTIRFGQRGRCGRYRLDDVDDADDLDDTDWTIPIGRYRLDDTDWTIWTMRMTRTISCIFCITHVMLCTRCGTTSGRQRARIGGSILRVCAGGRGLVDASGEFARKGKVWGTHPANYAQRPSVKTCTPCAKLAGGCSGRTHAARRRRRRRQLPSR
jgi:hypothetical protein